MPNKLTELISIPTLQRKATDYEAMCDDFVRSSLGVRISDKFNIPDNVKNADYLFNINEIEIILELKQITKFDKTESITQYFDEKLKQGKVRNFRKLSDNIIEINPNSFSKSEWNDFYKRFRPSITNNLKKAAQQLRDTDKFLPISKKPRIKGVFLLNSGDYNLPTDLLFRLIEWKMKREWKIGNFKSIDFVSCVTIDLYKENQSPLYARHIARTTQDAELVSVVKNIYEKWIHYAANAFGLKVTKNYPKSLSTETQVVDTSTSFLGKILFEKN